MTIGSDTSRADYLGTGSVGPFAFLFKIFQASDILVATQDTTGNITVLNYPTDYSLAGIGDAAGGSVTLTTALATSWALAIVRNSAAVQTANLQNQGTFFQKAYENALDYQTIALQTQGDAVSRSMQLPVTIAPGTVSTVLPAPQPGQSLIWSGDGTELQNGTPSGSVAAPGGGRTVGNPTAYLSNNANFNVLDFGAKGDGVTDDWAAFEACTQAAQDKGLVVIPFTATGYAISKMLNWNIRGMHVAGDISGFSYGDGLGPVGSPETPRIIYTGTIGQVFVTTYVGSTPQPFVTVENLCIDGNHRASVSFDGGNVNTHRNVLCTGATTAGLRLADLSIACTFDHSSYNANDGDGVLSLSTGDLTTVHFTDCLTRQNGGYGINGAFPASSFRNHISESNALSGANFVGFNDLLSFQGYFEANDSALGANGYNLRFAGTGVGDGIVFDVCKFGSIGLTKIAKVDSGRIHFTNCAQSGDTTTNQITVAAGAEVVCDDSFSPYLVGPGVKVAPMVTINPAGALRMVSVSDHADVNSPAVIFGTSDFAVSVVYSPDGSNQPVRGLLYGNAGAFQLLAFGSASGVYNLGFAKTNASAFHSTSLSMRTNQPVHIVYVRASGVASVYANGVLIDSFADANNYTVTQGVFGGDTLSLGLYGVLYAASLYTAAPTAQQVFDLWRCGGDPLLAEVTTGLVKNIDFERRGSSFFYETVNAAWIPFVGGTMAWLHPNPITTKPLASGSATYDPPSLVDGAGTTTTVTVTGAALGNLAAASFSLDLQGITLTAYVSAANTVAVRFQNESGGTLDLSSGTLLARLL